MHKEIHHVQNIIALESTQRCYIFLWSILSFLCIKHLAIIKQRYIVDVFTCGSCRHRIQNQTKLDSRIPELLCALGCITDFLMEFALKLGGEMKLCNTPIIIYLQSKVGLLRKCLTRSIDLV